MAYRIFGVCALVLGAVLSASGFAIYAKPLPVLVARAVVPASVAATQPVLQWPGMGEAALGANGFGVLATHGAQVNSPTASVAKVMDALMVLRVRPLTLGHQGPRITISQADVDLYNSYLAQGGSVAKVVAGEQITEYQALQALLLPSADNMADTLADWAYGSISAYSATANAYAGSIGMAHSHFGSVDASGLSPTTVSTAHDLVLLGLAALKNPVSAQIVNQSAATIPVAGTIHNVNWLLGSHDINGIKTGNSDQAGGVFLFSACQTFAGGRRVIVVGAVMEPTGTLYRAIASAVPLLKSAEASFSSTTLVRAGDLLGTYHVPWAGTVDVVAAKSLTAITWRGQAANPEISLRPLRIPAIQGIQVGTATYDKVGATPLITAQAIANPSWHWRLAHAF